ncbi:MAG: hypothetical protein Q8O43_08005 [Dehalococcoidia bacterium]|nr:hypothetical protein [Dehalococcoidia bacterium]
MKKPDLLVLIAIWMFITAFGAFIGIAAIVIFAFPAVLGNYWGYYGGPAELDYMGRMGGIFGLSIAILLLVAYLALSIIGGVGLLLSKPREWARIVSIVHSALSLFAFPVGTTIGVLSIIYLVRQDVRDYFNPPSPSPAI